METNISQQTQSDEDAQLGRPASLRSPLGDSWRRFRRSPVAMASMIFLAILGLLAAAAPVSTPYSAQTTFRTHRGELPLTRFNPGDRLDRCHWVGSPLEEPGCSIFLLGSNQGGQDLYSLAVYGARTSLAVALVASSMALLIGMAYGAISGYLGGWIDEAMMRVVDTLYGLPIFLVALGVQSFFLVGRSFAQDGLMLVINRLNDQLGGLLFLFVAIGAVNWVTMARMTRALTHARKRTEFVEAARAVGAGDSRILMRHVLPNILGPLVVLESLAIPGYIFLEATLSFLGLGVRGSGVSWGAMIHSGYSSIRVSPHIILVPSIALSLVTLAFNFIGDGLRDALDPLDRNR